MSGALTVDVDSRLIEARELFVSEALWVVEGRWQADDTVDPLPCVYLRACEGAHHAEALAALRAETQTLGLLAGVDRVPRVLHAAPGVLVRSRLPGLLLNRVAADALREPANALRLGLSLASVLQRVHAARVFHGRLQPNRIVHELASGETGLIGFGDAVLQSHLDNDFGPVSASRSLAFTAPEQTGRMGRSVDYRVDLYALGAILHWALVGDTPFAEADPLAQLHALLTRLPEPVTSRNPAVGPGLSAIIAKLLAKAPEHRYQSAQGLVHDLEHALAVAEGRALDVGFEPGRRDHRIQPVQPSRLWGREAEQAQLEAALAPVDATRPRTVMLRGYSGAGKSALVRTLHPVIAARRGMLAAAKFDQFQDQAPFDGVARALDQFARHVLTAPAERLLDWRRQLVEALGANADILMRLAPSFVPLLRGPTTVAAPWAEGSSDAGALALARMKLAVGAVLKVARRLGGSVVFFIDDLQWADALSLELIEMIVRDHPGEGLLLIGAYRDHEVDAAHPLSALLVRLRGAPLDLIELEVAGLAPSGVESLVADVLDDTSGALAPLARQLHAKTQGNAFFIMAYLRRLFESGALARTADGWTWQEAAVRALPASDNLVEGLLHAFDELPADVRELAAICACLGTAFDRRLLAQVTGRNDDALAALLLPLVQRDLLMRCQPPLRQADRDEEESEPWLGFGHDRMQQAAHALLDEPIRARWHARIAAVMTRQQALDAPAHSFEIAGHWLAAAPQVTEPEERELAARAWQRAAELALASGALERALSFTEAALAWPLFSATQRAHEVMCHTLLCRLGRHEQADALFDRLLPSAPEALAVIAPTFASQVESLSARRRHAEAGELALDCLRALGVEVPEAMSWDAAGEAEVEALYGALARDGESLYDALPASTDARVEATGRLLNAVPPSSEWRREVRHWAILRGLRLGREQGTHPALAWSLSMAMSALAQLRRDYALGARLAQAGVRLSERLGRPEVHARTLARVSFVVAHWVHPLERCLELNRAAHRLASEVGDRATVDYAARGAPIMLFETAAHLDAVEAQLRDRTAAVRFAGGDASAPLRQLLRALRGETLAPGSFDDAGFRAADYEFAVRSERTFLAAWLTYRGLAAAIFSDWPGALDHCRRAVGVPGLGVLYPEALRKWVHALALCVAWRNAAPAEAAPLRAELDPLASWLVARAADAPVNYGHMADLLYALKAWCEGDLQAAARAFEASIDAAQVHHRSYHHALACELAADFCQSQGLVRGAAAYLRTAQRAYADWGASAKAEAVRLRLAALAHGARGRSRADLLPSRDAPTGGVPTDLDLAGVARAAQALSNEREPRALVAVLFDLVRDYAAVERGVLFWRLGDDWQPRAGFLGAQHWIDGDDAPDRTLLHPTGEGAATLRELPLTVLRTLRQTLAPLILADASVDPLFGQDPRVRRHGIRGVLGLPIQHRGEAIGVLYLESRQAPTLLDTPQLELLRLIVLQFAIAYQNARMNLELEAQVAERTDALRLENAERRRAEEAAESANRAKGQFLANMSHEIRTPMNAILGMSHLALQSGLAPRQRNYIEKVERAAGSLLVVINDILDFSKIEAGKLDIESRPFELGDVMDHLASLVGLRAEEKGLELLFDESPRLPTALVGDAFRLGQVLVNLGNNAVKFTERGEVVVGVESLQTTPSDVLLRFSVRDTGVGIDPGHRARLFEAFSQADASTSRRFGGTGLGLAISSQLVGLMGGQLSVDSQPGVGSRFHFSLRFGRQERTDPLLGALAHEPLPRVRVLIVDDNASARHLLGEMVRAIGLDCEEVVDGWDALRAVAFAQAAGRRFELVLLDLRMPGMDGVACARELARGAAPPTVLMMTGHGIEVAQQQLDDEQVQVHSVLTKPITPSTLFDTCAAALGRAPRVDRRAPLREEQQREDMAQLNGRRILLVEDNDINREIAGELLGMAGAVVEHAADGREALAMVAALPYDLVLMDCQMPVMDGYEATLELRRDPRHAALPIIAMTANAMVDERARVLSVGMNDHIAKPIDTREMYATIARWLAPA